MALPKQDPVRFAKPKGNELKRMKLARSALLFNAPYWGILALRLKLAETTDVETAATDGRRVIINPSYIAALQDEELQGLWAHEITHCTNGHVLRREGRDAMIWNWACDYAVDPLLVNAGIKVPNATVNPEWRGLSAEQIYERLKEECNGAGGNALPTPKDYLLQPDPDDVIAQQVEWKQAMISAANAAKSQGKLPHHLEIEIKDMVEPKVDWRAYLRRFIQTHARDDFSWQRPSPRFMAMGAFMPSLRSERMGPIVVGIDTSGSTMSEQEAFAAEASSIINEARPERASIVFCDARVQKVQEFEFGDDIALQPKGGGGTSFVPVFEWVEKEGIEPACLIYLTDTFGDPPDEAPDYPVLWAVTVKHRELPFGEHIYIGE